MAESAIPHPHSAEPELRMDSMERRGQGAQLSFLCPCGKRIALKTLGCCRSCYDRRHHSLRFFGGLRERVLERDRFRCRGCGKRSALVVHHRDRVQPGGFAGHLVHPLPYADPSLVGMEILVLRNAGEIMARIASEPSGAASAELSKCEEEGTFERFS